MLTSKIARVIFGLGFSSITPVVMAGFATSTETWPNDQEVVGENITAPEIIIVKPKDLPPKCDLQDVSRALKRIYLKFGLNIGTIEFRHIRNQSQPPLNTGVIMQDNNKKDTFSWEIGAGSKISAVRYEFEYLYQKKVSYSPTQIVSGRNNAMASTVTNQTLLFNLFWDFDKVKHFKPYIGGITGIVWNQTRTTVSGDGITNISYKDADHYGIAWGFTIGARRYITKNCMGYVQYRYMGLSKITWKNITGILDLQGQYVYTGFSLGVNYVL